MNKKTIKIISILLLALLVVSFVATNVYASGDILSGVKPDATGDTGGRLQVKNASNTILGIIQIAGTAVAIGMVLFLGIKYMMAAPDEKASIKKSSTMYIIGAVILFAATNIVTIIAKFAQDTIK